MNKKDRLEKLIDSAEDGHMAWELEKQREQASTGHDKLRSMLNKEKVERQYSEQQDLTDWACQNLDDVDNIQAAAMYATLRLTRSIAYKHDLARRQEIESVIDEMYDKMNKIEPND